MAPQTEHAVRVNDKEFRRSAVQFGAPPTAQAPGVSVKTLPARLLASLLAALIAVASIASAQETPAPAATPAAPEKPTFSQQDLERIVAPIALYPDSLLAQIMMAATYPLEIVQAARWVQANPGLKDKALEDALAKQPWDPAVKSITAVPDVLKQMNDNLEWTQKLGDAFLAQRADVMNTVQTLRSKAAAEGNLKSSEQQTVKTETVESKTVYVIESAKPEVVYVPTYNPTVVYGTWPPAYPPYSVYPPAYVYPPGLTFATGVFVGAAIWGGCNWGYNDVNVNVNNYNNFNKTNISNGNWNHNTDHRKGVAYGDQRTANKYNRGNQGAQSRDSARGRDQGVGSNDRGRDQGIGSNDRGRDQGVGSNDRGRDQGIGSDDRGRDQGVGSNDRGRDQGIGSDRGGGGERGGGPSASTGDVGSRGSNRGASASTRDTGSRGGSGGFQGMNSGSSTRAASSRGSSSFSGRSGGGGRGGGGGGGRRR